MCGLFIVNTNDKNNMYEVVVFFFEIRHLHVTTPEASCLYYVIVLTVFFASHRIQDLRVFKPRVKSNKDQLKPRVLEIFS